MSTKTLSKEEISKSNLSDEGEMQKVTSSKISKATSMNPKIKELMKDKIFQYYFGIYYNSKEYSEFKSLPDQEKLLFMINLYFFVMKEVTKESLFDFKAVNTEEQMNNVNGEIMDRLLMLKDDFAKKRIVKAINIYNINNISEQGNLKDKFQSILDKYRMDESLLDKLSSNQWNQYPNSNNANNSINNANITNSNTLKQYNDQPNENNSSSFYKQSLNREKANYMQETTPISIPIPIHSMPLLLNNQNDNSNININNNPSSISLKKLSKSKRNSFVKIDYNHVSFDNLGPIEKGDYYIKSDISKEIEFTSDKYIFISNPNCIQANSSSNYIICKNKNLKHPTNNSQFTTQLNYKTLVNPNQVSIIKYHNNNLTAIGPTKTGGKGKDKSLSLIGNSVNSTNRLKGRRGYIGRNQNQRVTHNIVLLTQSINDTKLNVVLARNNKMPTDMNEIINKLYSNAENNSMNGMISLNTNEANKIGILLIEYIRLEKSFNELMNIKNGLQAKYERKITGLNKYKSDIESKLNETKLFLKANAVQ